jgi:hypothetical protein
MMGGDSEELLIGYLISIPAPINVFTIPGSTANGTVVKRIPVRATDYYDYNSFPGYQVGGNLNYIASMFTMFRGSLRYRFEFYTSSLATARIEISYETSNTSTGPVLSTSIVKQIIDVNGSQTVNLVVPYVYPTPYVNIGSVFGYLVVKLINKVVSSTANDTVTVMVMKSAAVTSQFIRPKNPGLALVPDPFTDESGEASESKVKPSPVGRSRVTKKVEQYHPMIQAQSYYDHRVLCNEDFTSTMQLARRFTLANSSASSEYYSFYSQAPERKSFLSLMSAMYAFCRGTINYKFIPMKDTAPRNVVFSSHLINDFTNWKDGALYPGGVYCPDYNGMRYEVSIPYYSNLFFMSSPSPSGKEYPSDADIEYFLPSVAVFDAESLTEVSLEDYHILEAAGTDFSMHALIGAPAYKEQV